MKIKFHILPDEDSDDYRELYVAEIFMDDGTEMTLSSSEDECSYDAFCADVFEDLFRSLADAFGLDVEIEEEDYASPAAPEVGCDYFADDLGFDDDRTGC